ncbi:EsaB/YukD family protein [Aristaeella hokkaidonensis]|uniref:EsaB/YukD family protein n=1 Tax=Aristaeella hokkaidonensis TaxID=3046382 RepID=UPI0034E20B78
MKEKVLIRISVPIANRSYDMKIPYDLTVGTASQVITKLVKSQSEDMLPLSKTPVLWTSDNGSELDRSKTIREIGTKDGDMFLLL